MEYKTTPVTAPLEAMGLVLDVSREDARWDLVHSWEPGVKCALGGRRHLYDALRGGGTSQEWARLLTAEPGRWKETWRRALELARDGDTSQAQDLLERALDESLSAPASSAR